MAAGASAEFAESVIAAIRAELDDVEQLLPELPIFEGGLELTSLRFFRVVGELEERLDIEFSDADLTMLAGATIGDLIELTASRVRTADEGTGKS